MHIFILLLLLTIITSCNNPGAVRMPASPDFGFNKEVQPLLKEGVYQVEYYASKKVTTEHKQILQKLSKLMETNSKTQEFFRQAEKSGNAAYDSGIGITRHEYDLVSNLFAYKVPEKLRGTLTISSDGDRFSFKGDDRLSLLDSLFVNKNKNASFKKYSMSQVNDSIDLSKESIPKGDTLEVYEFYSGPDGLLGLTGLDGVYELLIGRLRPSGKTYLSFFTRQPYNIEHPIPEYITVILD